MNKLGTQTASFPPMDLPIGLYPVLPSCRWLERLLQRGVRTLQLRVKHLAGAELEREVIHAIELGRTFQAQVFINDYWQLAIKHHAYGVHLGQEDCQQADFQKLLAAQLRLGISTHNLQELQLALTYSPSYVAIGHLFPTQTKQMTGPPQGVEALVNQLSLLAGTPAVAIGGINLARASAVLDTGISGIAVVTAITEAEDWQTATRQLQMLIAERRCFDVE